MLAAAEWCDYILTFISGPGQIVSRWYLDENETFEQLDNSALPFVLEQYSDLSDAEH